jgi:hypothetical protein
MQAFAEDQARSREFQQKEQRKREAYIAASPQLSQSIKEAILRQGLVIGMSSQDVIASMGYPLDGINKTVTAYGVREQWVYGRKYLYFHNGVLESWQE